jgi:putative glycosyltransferase (TIGR04348 family)
MKIFMVCPAPPRSRKGNRVTANRWARLLRSLGHRLTIQQHYDGTACDVLIALHARRSFEAVWQYRAAHPQGPLVVALTGTDLYRDIRTSRRAQKSLRLADRLVVLQRCGIDELPPPLHSKARVIYQSAEPTPGRPPRSRSTFEVSVLGHLRHEKDPFRTALAVRQLPPTSTIRVTHLGQALSPGMEARARAAMRRDPRYRWLGEVPKWQARRILARSHLLVLTSRMEGGANVVSEALADGVPVLSSRISGSEGILGERYPGFFPVGDTEALTRLLWRAESDRRFYAQMEKWCARLAPLVEPERERRAWESLLAELVVLRPFKEQEKNQGSGARFP